MNFETATNLSLSADISFKVKSINPIGLVRRTISTYVCQTRGQLRGQLSQEPHVNAYPRLIQRVGAVWYFASMVFLQYGIQNTIL